MMPFSSLLITPFYQICPFVSAAGMSAAIRCSLKHLPLMSSHLPFQNKKPTSLRSVSPLAPHHPGDHLKAAVQCLLLTQPTDTLVHSKHPPAEGLLSFPDSFSLRPPDFCSCLTHQTRLLGTYILGQPRIFSPTGYASSAIITSMIIAHMH